MPLEVHLEDSDVRFLFKQEVRGIYNKQSPRSCGPTREPLQSLLQGYLRDL